MFRRLMKLCLMTLLLPGCTQNTTGTSWCGVDSVITVSKQDKLTPDTAREILLHNDVGTKICGW